MKLTPSSDFTPGPKQRPLFPTETEIKVAELWDKYTCEDEVIEPGWAGYLAEPQLKYIRHVINDTIFNPHRPRHIRRLWGYERGSGHRVSAAGIRAVAVFGDPDDKAWNAELVRRTLIGEPIGPKDVIWRNDARFTDPRKNGSSPSR